MSFLKQKTTLLLALLISITTFAQQGINYKALIKDDVGNVISGQLILARFSIYQGDTTNVSNIVYQELHTPTTTANGIVVLNIGESTTILSGNFSTIDWTTNNHSLKTEINTGSGYVNMGITEFKMVPYAKHAETAANVFSGDYNDLTNQPTITYPSGLRQISENGYAGWRLHQEYASWHGDIGQKAIDLSIASTSGSPFGATGRNSFAAGRDTTAPSFAETVLGSINTDYTPNSTTTWNSNDRLFVIGNGYTSFSPSNALTVLKNGTITAPSFDISEITDDKALITKEYADTNYLMTSSNGDVSIGGEIQHTSTGNANMIPIAYGIVESNGDVLTGTGNFTAFLSGNVFIIDVNGTESLSYNNTVCLITPISTLPRTSSTIISDGNGDNDDDLNVRIFNANGTQVVTTFQFIIYKL